MICQQQTIFDFDVVAVVAVVAVAQQCFFIMFVFIWQTGFSEGPRCNPILATSSLYATASFFV
jgi:hypothetical protein